MPVIGSGSPDMPFDFAQVNTPAYVVDEGLLRRNLEILDSVQKQTGCRILLALKGFSMHAVFPLVGEYLAGITASALFEARLGREEMGKEVHIYAPAYIEADFPEILRTVDHIVFNSFSEWERYRERVLGCGRPVEAGIRINPEYSEISTPLYNPCYANSRLGVTLPNFRPDQLEGIDQEQRDAEDVDIVLEQEILDGLAVQLASVSHAFFLPRERSSLSLMMMTTSIRVPRKTHCHVYGMPNWM